MDLLYSIYIYIYIIIIIIKKKTNSRCSVLAKRQLADSRRGSVEQPRQETTKRGSQKAVLSQDNSDPAGVLLFYLLIVAWKRNPLNLNQKDQWE